MKYVYVIITFIYLQIWFILFKTTLMTKLSCWIIISPAIYFGVVLSSDLSKFYFCVMSRQPCHPSVPVISCLSKFYSCIISNFIPALFLVTLPFCLFSCEELTGIQWVNICKIHWICLIHISNNLINFCIKHITSLSCLNDYSSVNNVIS